MKPVFTFLFLFISCVSLFGQGKTYWVTFTDKNASTFTTDSPEDYLSPQAIARRTKFNIPIVENDLPVPQMYVDVINDLDAVVLQTSKWMNGATVSADEDEATQIADLSFVQEVKEIKKTAKSAVADKFVYTETIISNSDATNLEYGEGNNQITMIEGNLLHDMGYTGTDIEIAVFDNGFNNADSSIYFENARDEGRLIPVYDFVDNDTTVGGGSHGTNVLSTMLADIEGDFVGAAPDATYYLFRTEDGAGEGLYEEINWMMAAEKADSMLGENAIFTTSLGYSNGFNITADEHTYDDMDGNTTIITNAADMAASKGILVINSAGNEGNSDWTYITAPADGDSVLAIGAVNFNAVHEGFSGRGPSFDGRLKPNVCAQGSGITAVNTSDNLVNINGTSFSCPILAGYAACLWQSMIDTPSMDLFRIIEESAHLYNTPDNNFGYGVPNLRSDWVSLVERAQDDIENRIAIYPNPVIENTIFSYTASQNSDYEFVIYNMMGQTMSVRQAVLQNEENYQFTLAELSTDFPSGTYIFIVSSDDKNVFESFVVE
ncbi:MAG: S8 family peptidase [Chitinophagales bacterium]